MWPDCAEAGAPGEKETRNGGRDRVNCQSGDLSLAASRRSVLCLSMWGQAGVADTQTQDVPRDVQRPEHQCCGRS